MRESGTPGETLATAPWKKRHWQQYRNIKLYRYYTLNNKVLVCVCMCVYMYQILTITL